MENPSPNATVPASHELQTLSSNVSASTKFDNGSYPHKALVIHIFKRVEIDDHNVESCSSKDFYSSLFCNTLKSHIIRRGHVTCFATVKLCNYFGGLHGWDIAALAERVAIARARKVVGEEDKEISLVDLRMSYLSSAPYDSELIVDGSVVRSGRYIILLSVEFKMKKTRKLTFTSHATFHNSPDSKL
ncbi:hypothetical protein like AT3G61200 [Hibiscus trionum]|uniref:Thioesterase domain-containing protein n=1 Tax=Hibiscus trionum TaxID=183268 RepID=A0A9W7M9X2_HIBTR|nr:hypothetical protein like AT3G61200 [Hibiscus trionum]